MTRAEQVLLIKEARAAASSGRGLEVRQAAKLAQTEVAHACGVSSATISRWESGKRTPRGAAAIRYGRLLRLLSGAPG